MVEMVKIDIDLRTNDTPLVTVVIPCYNHGHYLSEAVESVLRQSYAPVEILVVDDGSVDNTAQVAAQYPQVRYIHQQNQGLSAARNTGIRHSQGEMLVFLDADDWLYPDAIATNVQYLQQNPQLAFVSGAYDRFFTETNAYKEEIKEVATDNYCCMLQSNYVTVPAAALYRKWVFERFMFNTALKACEDYDMYLHIFRNYPVKHHTTKVCAYRMHSSNMSSNIPLVLNTAMRVLQHHKVYLRSTNEKIAYNKGVRMWRAYYCKQQYIMLKSKGVYMSSSIFKMLIQYRPQLLAKYFVYRTMVRAGYTL